MRRVREDDLPLRGKLRDFAGSLRDRRAARAGALLLVLGLVAAAPAAGQRIAFDSARQSWTLRSGPVVYRLVAHEGRVALDYFGPAANESETTRVAPSYPRVPALLFAGIAGGMPLDSSSLHLAAQRIVAVSAGIEELRLTFRHATLPLEVEERYAAWHETGVITRELKHSAIIYWPSSVTRLK